MLIAKILLIVLVVFIIVKRADLYAFLAKKSFMKNDLKGAVRKFSIANRIGKLSAANLMYYGYYLLRDGQLEQAKSILTKASMAAKKPALKKNIKAMHALAEWKSGDLDTAIEMTIEAMKDYETTVLYQNLGLMYVVKGDARVALEFNKKASEYNSDDLGIMDNLAKSYVMYGDTETAAEIYEKILEKEPRFPEAYYGYGQLLVEKGDVQRGIELMEKSLSKRFSFLSVVSKEEVEKMIEDAKEKL